MDSNNFAFKGRISFENLQINKIIKLNISLQIFLYKNIFQQSGSPKSK